MAGELNTERKPCVPFGSEQLLGEGLAALGFLRDEAEVAEELVVWEGLRLGLRYQGQERHYTCKDQLITRASLSTMPAHNSHLILFSPSFI